MKEFFIKLGNNETYKKLMKEPLTYVAGAVLLAVFQFVNFVTLDGGWGVTSPLATWGAWIYQAIGKDVSSWAYFAKESEAAALAQTFFTHGGSIRNLGVIVGAFIATLYASQFKIKKIKSKKQVIAAIAGGLLMGYGARMASGCNIGALFTGISALSLSGWVYALFMFVGAYIGSQILKKYLM